MEVIKKKQKSSIIIDTTKPQTKEKVRP